MTTYKLSKAQIDSVFAAADAEKRKFRSSATQQRDGYGQPIGYHVATVIDATINRVVVLPDWVGNSSSRQDIAELLSGGVRDLGSLC